MVSGQWVQQGAPSAEPWARRQGGSRDRPPCDAGLQVLLQQYTYSSHNSKDASGLSKGMSYQTQQPIAFRTAPIQLQRSRFACDQDPFMVRGTLATNEQCRKHKPVSARKIRRRAKLLNITRQTIDHLQSANCGFDQMEQQFGNCHIAIMGQEFDLATQASRHGNGKACLRRWT